MNLALHKDHLHESEEYVKELENTIDDQLRIWQDEEETFRSEVTALREKSAKYASYENKHRASQNEVQELKQELFSANCDIQEIRSMNQKLEENRRKNSDVDRVARESTERYEEIIRGLQKEKKNVEREMETFRIDMEDMKEQSMSLDVENGVEIKKLKDQLVHASFRVQVMRNESPKRKRHGEESNDMSAESTIAQLMEQLKVADKKAEAAWNAKRHAEESLTSIKSIEFKAESGDKHQSEDVVEALTKKLYDARSRSRRIAVKSEEEMSRLRDSEEELRKLASRYEDQTSELMQRLTKLKHQYSEEFATRKRVESALRNEISLLRQDKVAAASSSPLPTSMKTHSNRIGKEMEQLLIASSTLQSLMDLNSKAKKKIGKDMLQKMATDTDELRAIVSRVEVAAEEDKLQIENAFNVYESAIESYETQLDDRQKKMKAIKDELSASSSRRMDDTKKSKQVEMDLQAKIKGLTLRLSHLQRDHGECKRTSDEASPESIQAMEKIDQVLHLAPSDEVAATANIQHFQQTGSNDTKPPSGNDNKIPVPRPEKKKFKMKLQHGAAKGDIEVNLREGNESMGASMMSTSARNDLMTSYRFLELSMGESAKADESNAKKEEVPQDDAEDSKIMIMDSSIGNDECSSDSTQNSRDFTSDLLNEMHSSQDSIQHQCKAEESLKDSISSGEDGVHDGSTNDSNDSDEIDCSKSYASVHNSLLESVEDTTEISTSSACDSGIAQSRGEDTIGGDSMIMQNRGDSMIMQNRGEASMNDLLSESTVEASMNDLLSESAVDTDLSGVTNARGEESFENSGIFNNEDVQDESTTDSKIRARSYDFSYDDATERSV